MSKTSIEITHIKSSSDLLDTVVKFCYPQSGAPHFQRVMHRRKGKIEDLIGQLVDYEIRFRELMDYIKYRSGSEIPAWEIKDKIIFILTDERTIESHSMPQTSDELEAERKKGEHP